MDAACVEVEAHEGIELRLTERHLDSLQDPLLELHQVPAQDFLSLSPRDGHAGERSGRPCHGRVPDPDCPDTGDVLVGPEDQALVGDKHLASLRGHTHGHVFFSSHHSGGMSREAHLKPCLSHHMA